MIEFTTEWIHPNREKKTSVAEEFHWLFPRKTDFEIIYDTYNPCECCDVNECDNCVLGRLWKEMKRRWFDDLNRK